MVSRKIIIGLLILIQVFALSPCLFECSLTYDGGLYASLGWSLYKEHAYMFNDQPGDVPPGFPLLIAPFFSFGENGMYLGPLLASFILVVASFLLMEKRFGLLLGFLGALLVFTSTMIYTYSAYVLRDLPALAFVMLSYLIYEKTRESRSRSKVLLLGLSMGMAFLTRYASLLALLPIIILASHKREKWFFIALTVGILAVLPWSLWSYENHGTPLKEHSTYYLDTLALDTKEAVPLLRMFYRWFFPLLIPLFLIGVLKEMKDRGAKGLGNPYLLLFVFTFIAFLLWPVKDERYLLPAVFPVVYFAIRSISRGPKYLVIPVLILFIFGQFWAGMCHINTAKNKYALLEDAGHWLRDNTPEDSRVMTQSFRQIAFYSHRRTDGIPLSYKWTPGFIKRYNVTHVLIDSYEKTTPQHIYRVVEEQGYEEVARFKDGYGEVIIYEV